MPDVEIIYERANASEPRVLRTDAVSAGAAGAAVGAVLGFMISPGLGAPIGSVIGVLAGAGIGALSSHSRR